MLVSCQDHCPNTASSMCQTCRHVMCWNVLQRNTHYTYTCEEQAELSGASSLSPSLSILAMLSGCNPPYGSLPPLNTSQQVTTNDHCIRPLFVTAVLLIVTACQLTTSVFSVKMASSKLSMAIHLIGTFTGASCPV